MDRALYTIAVDTLKDTEELEAENSGWQNYNWPDGQGRDQSSTSLG